MNNKEFVLKHCPTARDEKHKTRGAFPQTFYTICEKGIRIERGETKAQVWASAAVTVAERIVKAKYPVPRIG